MSKVIKMFYELRDATTGEVLESNIGGSEVAFVTTKGQVLDALENGVADLQAGERKEIKIAAKDAFGEYDDTAVQILPIEQFAGIDLKVGGVLFGENEDGSSVQVVVKNVTQTDVTIDYNHSYAGRDLIFNVEITENRDADENEEKTGVVDMPHSCSCGGGDCCGGGHHHDDDGCCCGH